jgi:hypothetical protein
MYARWKLGRALEKFDRSKGGRPGKNSQHDADSLKIYLKTLDLDWTAAQRAQRIGSLPSEEDHAARWKLGRALEKIERGAGPGRGKKSSHDAKSFMAYTSALGLNKDAISRAQRIGTLPSEEDHAARFLRSTASSRTEIARRRPARSAYFNSRRRSRTPSLPLRVARRRTVNTVTVSCRTV